MPPACSRRVSRQRSRITSGLAAANDQNLSSRFQTQQLQQGLYPPRRERVAGPYAADNNDDLPELGGIPAPPDLMTDNDDRNAAGENDAPAGDRDRDQARGPERAMADDNGLLSLHEPVGHGARCCACLSGWMTTSGNC